MKLSKKYFDELDKSIEEHYKKYGTRSMTMEELDELLGLK